MAATTATSANARSRPPLWQRLNYRLILVAAVVLAIVGFPVYQYLSATWNDGVARNGEVDLKALGNFPFDELNGTEKDVPPKYRALDGKHVILEGYQYAPQYSSDRVPDFQYVYNIAKCCFGGPPKVQERVFAHVPNNGTLPFFGQYSQIEGTLHVRVQREGGKVISLYDLDVVSVKPM